jgi:beta-glucanase (GH16 family)
MATNNALHESFDNGIGAIGNAWNVDTSVKGQVKLSGNSALMEWATGKDAGHGYGTYTVHAKLDGGQPGSAILLWPGDNNWPGAEIDMAEITPDGSGRQYGTVHWNSGGNDAYIAKIYDGVQGGVFHDYQLVWEPGKLTYKVDGAVKATITEHVPADYAHGGMNNVIGFLNNNPSTSLTVTQVDFAPLGGGSAPIESAVVAAPTAADAASAAAFDWNAAAAEVMENYHETGIWG